MPVTDEAREAAIAVMRQSNYPIWPAEAPDLIAAAIDAARADERAKDAASITELEAEVQRLRDNAKANNMLARHETAGRKDQAMRRALLANALEALCEAVERGDASAQDVTDCRLILARAALGEQGVG